MIDSYNIGKQIKELRMSRGWKQYQLADKVGMSRTAISNIEAGRRSLTINSLHKFAEVFQISVATFGINVENFNEAVDLTTRLEKIFSSDDIPAEKKDELYRDIMKIYLDSKT